jgi:hypothetical protein
MARRPRKPSWPTCFLYTNLWCKMNLLLAPSKTTYSAERLSENFHRHPPSDTRYVAITRLPYPPSNTVSQSGCLFRFPPITDIYLIHDIKCQMRLRLVTKTRPFSTPANGALVGTVNSVMQSMISQARIHIGDTTCKYDCQLVYKRVWKYFFFLLLQCKTKLKIINTSVTSTIC